MSHTMHLHMEAISSSTQLVKLTQKPFSYVIIYMFSEGT